MLLIFYRRFSAYILKRSARSTQNVYNYWPNNLRLHARKKKAAITKQKMEQSHKSWKKVRHQFLITLMILILTWTSFRIKNVAKLAVNVWKVVSQSLAKNGVNAVKMFNCKILPKLNTMIIMLKNGLILDNECKVSFKSLKKITIWFSTCNEYMLNYSKNV